MINSRIKSELGEEIFIQLQKEVDEASREEFDAFIASLDPDSMGTEDGQEGINDGD